MVLFVCCLFAYGSIRMFGFCVDPIQLKTINHGFSNLNSLLGLGMLQQDGGSGIIQYISYEVVYKYYYSFFTKKGIIIVGSAFGKTTIEDQAD